jgi:metal-responsive CopG/Arc/MetJ family transcriptional regulator
VSRDGSYTVVVRSAVPKKRKGFKIKQRILKALARVAAREEEGISEIIGRALKQYLKKTAKKKRSRRARRVRT